MSLETQVSRELQVVVDDEAPVIASILDGEIALFHDLIRSHERTVYVMILSVLQNEADAEDAVQETFLKAFRNLSKFRSESKFSTWLTSIALNEARNRLRTKRVREPWTLNAGLGEIGNFSPTLLRDWREVPLEALERQEVRGVLEDAVMALPEIYREIILLRDVEELSVQESATTLGISESAVKVRLHRAHLMLKKMLAPKLKRRTPKRRLFPW
jgi:RNA polymerase sigma-70 factor (ECF subfamily)